MDDTKFVSLEPTITELKNYESALDYAFSSEGIHNIAISGPYSSGKSSVLKSYEEIHKENKYIHITLASFSEQNSKKADRTAGGNGSVQSSNEYSGDLEIKIINQLLHQIDYASIRQTRFSIKREQSKGRTFGISIACFALIVLILCSFGEYFTCITPTIRTVSRVLLLISFIPLFAAFLRTLKTPFAIKKVELKGVSAEVSGANTDSYFDKYLDEILYLIEHSGAKAIVFEDLDRHETVEIFTRIREISDLIQQRNRIYKNERCNNHSAHGHGRFTGGKPYPPKFVFLMRDDLFQSEDRCKFFDFIIPIIPIADPSNSADVFHKLLKEQNLLQGLDEGFLEKVSLFLSDMRVIKSIVNEYGIYKERLKDNCGTSNMNEQLAMIVYKNLCPHDFTLLQMGKGYVYSIITNKNEFAQRYYSSIESQKTGDMSTDELRKQKNRIMNLNLSGLIRECGDKFVWGSDLIKSEEELLKVKEPIELIRFLLSRGYVNENYDIYTSVFHEEMLTRTDKDFLRSVLSHQRKPAEHQLDHPQKVLARLEDTDFACKEILNNDLFAYLMESKKKKEQEKLDLLLQAVDDWTDKSETDGYEFLLKYWDDMSDCEQFVNLIASKRPQYIQKWVSENSLKQFALKKTNDELVRDCLANCSQKQMGTINAGGWLTEWLSQSRTFLLTDPIKLSKYISNLHVLNVAFQQMDVQPQSKELVDHIYEENLYEFNAENIRLRMVEFLDASDNDATEMSFSLLKKNENDPLSQAVFARMDEYMNIRLKSSDGDFNDSLEDVLEILNCADISIEAKKDYIGRMNTVLDNVVSVSKALWPSIVERTKAVCSYENCLSYYIEFCKGGAFDKILVEFINSGAVGGKRKWEATKGASSETEVAKAFYQKFVLCNEISSVAYETILQEWDETADLTLTGISKEHMSVLISLKRIPLKETHMSFIQTSHLGYLGKYINAFSVKELNEFVQNGKLNFTKEGIESILAEGSVSRRKKEIVLGAWAGTVQMRQGMDDATKCLIIKRRKLTAGDLENLMRNYQNESDIIQSTLLNGVKESPEYFIQEIERVKVCSLALFAELVDGFDKDQVAKWCEFLEDERFKEMIKTIKQQTLEDTDVNRRILSAFQEKKLISSVGRSGNLIRVYPFRRNRVKS